MDACGNRAEGSFSVTVQDSARPSLAIGAGNGLMQLTWPASCQTYTLQTTTDLVAPIEWLPAPATPMLIGDTYLATAQPTNATRYFRLRGER